MDEKGLLLGYMFFYYYERNDTPTIVIIAHDRKTADELLEHEYPEIYEKNKPAEPLSEEIREGVVKGPC